MNISEIKEMIQAVMESGVAELEVQRGDDRVRIVRSVPGHESAALSAASGTQHFPPTHVLTSGGGAAPAVVAEANLLAVKSPIVGTFYESPSPESGPFVRVGDPIKPGQVLCIVESMKLMNEIESEVEGILAAKLVENGSPVEYGETLFTVRPH